MKILVELQVSESSLAKIREIESLDSFNIQYDDDETDKDFFERIVNEKLNSLGIKANVIKKL